MKNSFDSNLLPSFNRCKKEDNNDNKFIDNIKNMKIK